VLRKGQILAVLVIGVSVTSFLSISAQNFMIPEWIKNNAGWWSEGAISESDYISSLQYLISEGIIKIPIKQIFAAETTVSEEYFASSFVVHMNNLERGSMQQSFYSFSKIVEFGETVSFSNPKLHLESIPSVDKEPLYRYIEDVLERRANLESLDISIDIIAKDGSIIETLEYTNCELEDYFVYVNDREDQYRFGKADKMEIREVTNFDCGDYSVRP